MGRAPEKEEKMKKIIIVISALLMSAVIAPVQAADTPLSIAVIDTGTNTALFPNAIVGEACFVSMFTCPNGKAFMEGVGAANLPPTTNATFNHASQMISIALKVNPTAKIVLVRIVGMSSKGMPGLYNLDDVKKALDWVIDNREKYNVGAVLLAQGKIFPNCKVPAGMTDQVATLKAAQVPLIAAVGNDSNRTTTMAPSCLPDAVSVGATDNPWPGTQGYTYDPKAAPYIARYSNGATGQVDFYLNARWKGTMLDGSTKFMVGTSNAAAALAGYWTANRKATFDETYAWLLAGTTEAKNQWVTGRYVYVEQVIT